MKIRTGFVSNSSSTSFITGIAIIDDIAKFVMWLKNNSVRVEYSRLSELSNMRGNVPTVRNEIISIEAVNGAEISLNSLQAILNTKRPEDKLAKTLLAGGDDPYIAWFYEYGKDPEWNDEKSEYNYNEIDTSWFEDNYCTLYDVFKKQDENIGIIAADAMFGGGRDG